VTGPFGVDYREVSKADKKSTAENLAIGAGTAGGAWAGQGAVIWPDYHYNEKIHKPWFGYQKDQALKNEATSPANREAAKGRADKVVADTDKSYPQRRKQAEAAQRGAIEGREYKDKATGEIKRTPPDPKRAEGIHIPEPGEIDAKELPKYKADRELGNRGSYQHPSKMTGQQARGFEEYIRKPPEHLQREYGFNPEKSAGSPENKSALAESNWHKSKGFFRNFPKDLPGSNYRRAGGWYAKGKTGHAVALGAMGAGAYLGYKGTKKAVDSNKVEKKLKLPKALRPKYVTDKEHFFSPTYLRDPGFMVPAGAIGGSGLTGYVLAKKRKKSGKKELT
jgi:hypothetical protein